MFSYIPRGAFIGWHGAQKVVSRSEPRNAISSSAYRIDGMHCITNDQNLATVTVSLAPPLYPSPQVLGHDVTGVHRS